MKDSLIEDLTSDFIIGEKYWQEKNMPGLRLFRNDPRLLFLICSLISRDRLIILPLKRKYARTMFNQNPAVAVVIILWQASMLLQVERSVIILQQAGIN